LNPLKKLAGQTAIYGTSTIVARLLNYLLVPLHTRIFAPESYGVVGEMYAYVSLLIVLLTYGMETAFFRYYNNENNKDKVYSSILTSLSLSSVVFILFAWAFAQPIADLILHPKHSEYVVWFAMIIAFDALSTIPFAKLRAENKSKRFAYFKILNIGINVILNLFYLLLCPYLLKHGILTNVISAIYNENTGVGYIFIANLIASGATLLFLFLSGGKTHFSFDWPLLKKMLKYALPLLIFGLAGIVNETMDRIFLKYLSPQDIAMEQVGIYTACYKISILMTIFIQGFKYAAEPFFFANAKDSNAKQVFADVMKYFVLACSLIFLGVMMYIDVVKFFVGEKYYVGLPVVPILLMANLFLGVFYNLSIWYKLTDKTRFGAYISLFGAIITIILNLTLIPVLGFMGSAWATFICYFCMMVVSFILGQRHYYINYDLKRILTFLTLSVVLYGISALLDIQIYWLRLTVNTVFFVTFIVVVYYMEHELISKLNFKNIFRR
jgi:O-antigen/teichoic acid export membrane protein